MKISDCKNTINWFLYLSDTNDIEKAFKLCAPAKETVERALYTQNTPVEEHSCLYSLAGSLAYYKYCLISEKDETGFKAGDIRIGLNGKTRTENAKELLEFAIAEALKYLKSGKIITVMEGV